MPFAHPQTPFTGFEGLVAEQFEDVHPLAPSQVQLVVASTAGNAGETGFGVPDVQKVKVQNEVSLAVNAVLAVPQAPFTGAGPASVVQVGEHPSPAFVFPSSHCSSDSVVPFPQTAGFLLALHDTDDH